jgi:hypothetical protein
VLYSQGNFPAAEEAFAEAEGAEPRALPAGSDGHDAVGRQVTVAPDDYGRIGVTGVLVAATADRYILSRDTERLGTLHVHFPVSGYVLTG